MRDPADLGCPHEPLVLEVINYRETALGFLCAETRIDHRQALLAVKHVICRVHVVSRRQAEFTDVALHEKPLVSSPQQQAPDRIVIRDTIEQIERLVILPDERALKLRHLDLAPVDASDQSADKLDVSS